ncbi:N-acetylglucosamine-6-phosphate deacetylase [Schlesneria paludicola]|uniref:N-acetylglucosamine-6-phosphate deacetylase n=1 Tax=Schlesneria paludicola TaxID=360056 RepID=UPI00029B4E82|nr:amidohydrolase family protein [Schlesneria paludicola]
MDQHGISLYGRHYANGEPVRVQLRGDRIQSVEPAWPKGDVRDWPYVAPALLDLQINGFGGVWFSDDSLTPDAVLKTLEPYYQFGVTRLCPTLITNSFEGLETGFSAIRRACEQAPWANRMVCGCHLEGPYISAEDGARGAHPKQHVRPASWEEFEKLQRASGNRIRLVTLAPEAGNAIEFIRRAVADGIVISIGHTAATPEQIRAAADAGATLSTHLGNGAVSMMHRHRNVIYEQLGDPRLNASLIVDGHHLPANLVQIFIRAKTIQKTIMTCDAAGWAGCPPGIYENKLGRSEILPSGKLVVAGQHELLAGSAQGTDTCVVNAIKFAGVTLKEAVDMASENPARLLGQEVVRLRAGSRADLMLFRRSETRDRLDIEATIASGELKFGTLVAY